MDETKKQMKNILYFKNTKVRNIDEMLENFNSREFKSPFRSTIPLLILYKNQPGFCFNLLKNKDDAIFCFESETKVGKGRGRSSCTDLMIATPETCIAVEAKRTEPPYPKVKTWLGSSENKHAVLEGWIEMIVKYTGVKFNFESVQDLPYQIVHRVASACAFNKPNTHVIYLCFDINKTQTIYYNNILNQFSDIVSKKINFHLISMKLEKFDEQRKLEMEWNDKKTRDVSTQVVTGIKNNTLMQILA